MEHSQPHWQVRAYLQWQESERMTRHSLQGRKGLSTAMPLMSLVARLHQLHIIRPGQMRLCRAVSLCCIGSCPSQLCIGLSMLVSL